MWVPECVASIECVQLLLQCSLCLVSKVLGLLFAGVSGLIS
jgi:hypothetical protein